MYLDPTCIGLSQVAMSGIKEIGQLAMLLCNTCVENNERDSFIRCRNVEKMNEKLEEKRKGSNDQLVSMKDKATKLISSQVDSAATQPAKIFVRVTLRLLSCNQQIL